MDILHPIFSCLGFSVAPSHPHSTLSNTRYPDEKSLIITSQPRLAAKSHTSALHIADTFTSALLTGRVDDPTLRRRLKQHFLTSQPPLHTESWYSTIAEAILARLTDAVRTSADLSSAAAEALTRATSTAKATIADFARDHPVYCTLLAIGILALLAPYVLEAVGFAELGIVEGSWAALWQSRYAGFVPKGSLFSFLQRLGMTLRWYG